MCAPGEKFRGKRVTVMGIDPEGRGVQDVIFLSEHGAEVIATDIKREDQLQESAGRLRGLPGVQLVLGEHRIKDFKDRDLVIRAASAPLDSNYLIEAKKNNIPVETDETLFIKHAPEITILGVTGTRGKSTTVACAYHILQNSGVSSGGNIFLGGNVRGAAMMPLLKEVKAEDIVVMELSSWQLQGFGEAKMSPQVAVFTSFMPDHLNYYKGDLQRYFDDKAHIFAHQEEGDTLIVSEQAWVGIEEHFKGEIVSDVHIVKHETNENLSLAIPGPHNKVNALLAIEACVALGVDRAAAVNYAESFPGIPYRLEFVREIDGVQFYNDSNATSPDAVIAALRSFPGKRISLIAGGTDKNLAYEELARVINDAHSVLTLLPGTATDKLKVFLEVPHMEAGSMKEAIEIATRGLEGDGIVLLSPGAASFGLFKNEYDRGDQFRECVQNL